MIRMWSRLPKVRWFMYYYWRRFKCLFGRHLMVGVLKHDPWDLDDDDWKDAVDYYYCLNCRKGER